MALPMNAFNNGSDSPNLFSPAPNYFDDDKNSMKSFAGKGFSDFSYDGH
jgi:hypothetical protein